jgi:hypothetical protein
MMKVINLYYNQKFMTMAINLYYHCWFARARLQKNTSFPTIPYVALPLCFSPLFLCSCPPLPQLHAQTKTKERKKKQNQKKNKETTKISNKDTK